MTGKKELVAAIDVYVSDFGTLTIMPSRFLETRTANSQTVAGRDVFVLDWKLDQPCSPTVAVMGPMPEGEGAVFGPPIEVIDLSRSDLSIAEVNGHDVSKCNFEVRVEEGDDDADDDVHVLDAA